MSPFRFAAVVAAAGLAAATLAAANDADLGLTLGLGEISLDDEAGFTNVFGDGSFSGRLELQGSVALVDVDGFGSGPRLGGRLGFGYAREDLGERSVAGEPFLNIEDYADLLLVTPQLTGSYRQYFPFDRRDNGLFVEPGVGVGPAFGFLSFGEQLEFGDDVLATEVDSTEDDASWGVQPYLRAGFAGEKVLIGAEGGYLVTGLDFDDDLGADASQWYVGIVVAARLGR